MADRPLRLLVAGISWPPETFLARLIHGLAADGVDVTVATDRKPERDWPLDSRLHWLRAPAWDGPAAARLLRLGWMAGRAAVAAPSDARAFVGVSNRTNDLSERAQIWHRLLPFAGRRWDAIYFPWNSAAIAYMPLFDLGCPVVISCRGAQVNVAPHNPRRAALRDGLRVTFEKASAVHCVSAAVLRESERYGLDPAKATIIHPAVDPDFFCPAEGAANRERLRMVSTGALIWREGYEYMLLALRGLLDRGVPACLEIVGDGPERQRLLYTIHDLGLADRVRLLGRLPPDAVRARLRQADVFVLASLSEGLANAALEAMACGLPVVATDCGGMREAIDDGVEGLIVPVRAPAAMAAALARLAADPRLARRMGAAGRQRVLRQFTLDRQVARFKTMFQSVLLGENS